MHPLYTKNVNTHTPTLINYPSSTITFNLHPAPRAPTNAVERENRGSRRNTCLSRKTRVHFSATLRPLRILYYDNSIVHIYSEQSKHRATPLIMYTTYMYTCVIYYIYNVSGCVSRCIYALRCVCFNNLYKR